MKDLENYSTLHKNTLFLKFLGSIKMTGTSEPTKLRNKSIPKSVFQTDYLS